MDIIIAYLLFQVNSVPFNLAVSWPNARADCLSQGADLASFHNASALDYLWRNELVYVSVYVIVLHRVDVQVSFTPPSDEKPYVSVVH